ncbi:ABC transporter ATP-binding protein/permease [archaeon]|nr:MAG: ABC transporter ATP-binding protein/permease [archaeon]
MLLILLIFLVQCSFISPFRHFSTRGCAPLHICSYRRQGMRATSKLSMLDKPVSGLRKPNVFNQFTHPQRKMHAIKSFFKTELPMLQYLWPKDNMKFKVYLVFSMVFMFLGKWFNLRVPFVLQSAIDSLSPSSSLAKSMLSSSTFQYICLYGVYRALSVLCTEIKTCLFTHVSQTVLQQFACQIFAHLHSLDSNFHLNNPSGVISVAYVRAIRGLQTLLFQIVFSITPTILEFIMVSTVLYRRFGGMFAYITLCTCVCYILYTIFMTEYRVKLRTELVEVDNQRNAYLIDTLVNHEIVKLFTQSAAEQKRYKTILDKLCTLNILSTYSVGGLNVGQGALFSFGLVCSLLYAAHRVQAGKMTMGDVVAVNGLLLQLSVPFNFIGYTCKLLDSVAFATSFGSCFSLINA